MTFDGGGLCPVGFDNNFLGGNKVRRAKKPVFFIVFVFIIAFEYLTFFGVHYKYGDIENTVIKGVDEIRWGIDIQGGVNATFGPDGDYDATKNDMDSAKAVIEQRLLNLNVTDSEVYVDYTKNKVIVSFPWQAGETDFDPESAVKELGETAILTFVKGSEQTGEEVMTGEHVTKAESLGYKDDNGDVNYVVSLELDGTGKTAFGEATTELAGTGNISIWMDDACISDANVNSPITDGKCQIEGNFTYDEAKALADKINAGSLPFKLVATSTNIVSPTLGTGARTAMLIAGIIAFAFVGIYLISTYRLPGFVATIALIGQVVGSIACISGFFEGFDSFTLTIPGIAGIILSIGMGVDANIIVSERIKEELKLGKTLNGAIEQGYKRAWSAVFDSNITVIFVAIILMGSFGSTDSIFGTLLKPFFAMFGASMAGTIYSLGFTLMIGIITNFIFGIFCSRLMLESLAKFKVFRKRSLCGVKDVVDATPVLERKRYSIVQKGKVFYIISSLLVLTFVGLTIAGIPKIAIEFKGGTLISYTYEGEINTSDVESIVKETTGQSCRATLGEDFSSKKSTLQLSFSSKEGISETDQEALKTKLEETYPDNSVEILESTNVSPTNGKTFFGKCLVALLIAVVVMILYIGIRFKNIGGISAGSFAVVALLHDMAMVYGSFVILGFDINSNFIAVLLTIMGYSINSTIIIYDRIRENKRLYGKRLDIAELTNMSITQTIARNVHTNITTIAVMIIVTVVCSLRGVTSIISFSLPLIVGMLSGVYTSMCLAPSLWVKWQQHREKKNPKRPPVSSKKKKKSEYKDTGFGYGAQV